MKNKTNTVYIIGQFHAFIIDLEIYTNIHLNKLVDNACCLLEKQNQLVLPCQEYFTFYPR